MAKGGVEPRVEHYLLVFLRLCSTAMPTVEVRDEASVHKRLLVSRLTR